MPEHQEAPEVLAGIVSAADAAGIGYDNLNVKLDNGDGNQSQIEPDEVVSALEEEFGSDAAFLAAASSPPASKADRPKQQEEYITYQVA